MIKSPPIGDTPFGTVLWWNIVAIEYVDSDGKAWVRTSRYLKTQAEELGDSSQYRIAGFALHEHTKTTPLEEGGRSK